jgi:hypothetical protein
MSRIHLTIDRLVLKGLQPGQDKALVESLRAQLAEMLKDRRTRAEWARSHRTPVLKLGRLPLEAGSAGGRKIGAQIARGIARGL